MSAPDPGRVSWPKYALIVLGAAAGAEPRSADLGGPARVIRRTYASRGQALRPLQRPQAHPFTDSRPSPASQRPLQSGAQVAAAAQVPTTGRRRRGGTCTYCAWRRKQAAESPGRVLYAPGRPAVCKRGLLPAARGLSGEPEGVGRLRMNDAALCRALCRFRTAAAACGHGGRAAASGGKHTCVCRRIRCPFLVLHADQLALQEISFSPKPRAPAPKGSRRQHKGGSRPLPHSHQRRYLDLSGCCDMRGQMLMYTRIEFAHDGVKQPQICSPALIKRSHAAAGGSSSHRQHR